MEFQLIKSQQICCLFSVGVYNQRFMGKVTVLQSRLTSQTV